MAHDLALKDQDWIDDGWLVQWRPCAHESRLYTKVSQLDRDIILSRNAELRKNPGVIEDRSLGRYSLSIPLEDYENLKKKYPVLVQGDNQQRTAFYKKFISMPESLPFRVQG